MDFNKIAERVQSELGNKASVKVIQCGIQVRATGMKYVINFYYSRKGRRYYHSGINSTQRFTKGQESEIVIKLLDSEESKIASIKTNGSVIELTDKGTQACIDHIARKIEAFQRVHDSEILEGKHIQVLTIMKTIKQELEQYL